MDKKEFLNFAAALKTYYPRESLLPNQQAVELWYRQLQDLPYNVAQASLNKWVAVSKWAPTIADIRETAISVTHGATPDWGEGWQQVMAAIRNYGSYRIPEALNSLDPVTRKCVERLGFKNICTSENLAADRANFRTLYEQIQTRERKDAQIPEVVRLMIEQIRQDAATIEDKRT